jgi:4-amino-4-deoxy-L-arabinose transferase-like glycosyltransferase
MGKTNLWRHPWHLIWILAAYVPFLWKVALPFTGDEKTYIATAMEMRERGAWLRPYLFGEPSYLKPPFQYWMTLLGWQAFGFNSFGTYLPSVLALVATAWFLNEIASLLGERRWYVNSGLWFACSVGAMTYALSAQMDIWVCLFYAAAWWAGLRYLAADESAGEERCVRWLYAAFTLAGLSSIVKSPLYAVLWVAGYLLYLLVSGEWLLFKNRHLYLAWLSGILAGSAWFLALLAIDGEPFWQQYFLGEQLVKGSNGGTLGDLWIPLLYLAAPLTLLLVTAIRSAWMGRRTAAVLRFVIAWCLPPALFFSMFPYRTSLYLFILVPALAVLVDWGCFRANRTRTFRLLARTTGVLYAVALGVGGLLVYRAGFAPAWLFLALAFTGVAAAVLLWFGWMRLFTVAALVGILFVRMASIEISRPEQAELHAAVGPVSEYQAAMLDESRDIWKDIGRNSVAIGSPMRRLFNYDDIVDQLDRGGVVILNDEETEKYRLTLTGAFESRGRKLEWKPWRRFKRRKKLPLKTLLLKGREAVPDLGESIYREFSVVREVR